VPRTLKSVNRRHRVRYPRDILDGLFEEAAHHCAQLMDIASDLRRRNGDCTLDEVLVVVEIRTRDYAIDHSVSERHKRFAFRAWWPWKELVLACLVSVAGSSKWNTRSCQLKYESRGRSRALKSRN
jgi:hypothetical protein